MRWLDFTQEFKNAVGTKHESNGEWFKLGAQLYFYGWASADETEFSKWVILDIAKYKILVEQAGLFCSGGPANFPIESNAPANDSKKDIFDVMPEHSSCCLCSGALSNKPQFQGCLVSERFHFY